MKIDNYIKVSCYRYAPETFTASVYGKELQLSIDEKSTLGMALICKGKKACIDEIKKIIRKRQKSSQYVTIGFFDLNEEKVFHYTNDLIARRNDMSEKLSIYKAFKRYLISLNCKLPKYEVATLGAAYEVEDVEPHYSFVNIKKPVLLKVM